VKYHVFDRISVNLNIDPVSAILMWIRAVPLLGYLSVVTKHFSLIATAVSAPGTSRMSTTTSSQDIKYLK